MTPESYGAHPDGTTDCTRAFQKALDAAAASVVPAELRLSAGTYVVSCPGVADGSGCLSLTRPLDSDGPPVVIAGVGDSSQVLVTTPTAGLFTSTGVDVTVRDLSVDYDPLPFSQGVVTAVYPTLNAIDVAVESGYPTPGQLEPWLSSTFLTIYDSTQPRLKSGMDGYAAPIASVQSGTGTWRINLTVPVAGVGLGDRYVLPLRTASVLVFQFGRQVELDRVTLYAGPGIATVWYQNSESILINGLTLKRRPGTTRLLSTDADGIHMFDNHARTVIKNGWYESMGDDGINTRTTPLNVLATQGSQTVWVDQRVKGLAVGHRVQVVNPASQPTPRGVARIRSTQRDPANGRQLIMFDAPIAGVQVGDVLFDVDLANPELLVVNNTWARTS